MNVIAPIHERHSINEIETQLRYKQLTDIVWVYNVRVYLKDGSHIFKKRPVLKDIWRLCFVNELDQLEASPIMFAMQPDRELDLYTFFKKEIIEALKHDADAMYDSDYSIGKIQNKFEQYQFVMDNDTDPDNIIVAKRDMQNDDLYALEYDIPLAKREHFDYDVVNNCKYDLSRVIDSLTNREDIYFYKHNDSIIRRICSYADDDDDEAQEDLGYYYIEFDWLPSDADWQKYCESKYFNSFDRYQYIADEILGLKNCRI